MIRYVLVVALITLSCSACKKDNPIPTDGVITLDNKRYEAASTYYVYGFLFSQAKRVSTLSATPPDVSILETTDLAGVITGAFLAAANFKDSFYHIADYSTLQEAKTAFNSYKVIDNPLWEPTAMDIKPFQLYAFRTGSDKFALMVIHDVITETREGKPFAEVTFGWVFQPDGTNIFP